MKQSLSINQRIRRRWLPASLLALTILLGLSLGWSIDSIRHHNHEVAIEGARNIFRMVVLTRQWNAEHGGVYVPVSESTPSNPYLDSKRRDVRTDDAQTLTLVNPAYMTRQIAEMAEHSGPLHIHITSLKPIRPANRADEWEAGALRNFELGKREEYGVVPEATRTSLRYMAPLIVNQSCMSCHAVQGYRIGDVRGGISVSLDYAPIAEALQREIRRVVLTHGGFLAAGVAALLLLFEALRRRWMALEQTLADLEQTRNTLVLSEKMASLGRLVSGFADEIKGPVTQSLEALRQAGQRSAEIEALLARGEVSQSSLRPSLDGLQEHQRQAQVSLRRSADLIEHFRRVSADQSTSEKRLFLLAEAIGDVLSSMRHTLKAVPVDVQVSCPPTLTVFGVPGQYESVLTSLLLNCVGHGFSNRAQRGHLLIAADLSPDRKGLSLRISDDGDGMSAEQLAMLFEPLGSNKPGNDSGLYLAHVVVTRELGGSLRCESAPGKGTHFFVDCPLEQPAAQERQNMVDS